MRMRHTSFAPAAWQARGSAVGQPDYSLVSELIVWGVDRADVAVDAVGLCASGAGRRGGSKQRVVVTRWLSWWVWRTHAQ